MAKDKKPVPQTIESFDYEITFVSEGCTDFTVGQIIPQYFNVPPAPPATVTLDFGEPCNVVKAKRVA